MAESSGSVVVNSANIGNKLSSVQSSDSPDDNKTDKEMKPICVDDFHFGGELPQSVKNVFEFLETTKPDAGQTDILVALIYVLILEAKFYPEDNEEPIYDSIEFNYTKILKYSKKVPVVRTKGVQRINFIFPDLGGTKCTLACVEAGEDLLVNFTVLGVENEYFSYCLDPATYFSSCQVSLQKPCVQNLRHLSKEVKNNLTVPASEEILSLYEVHYLGHTCFSCIPDFIILQILSYLNVRDRLRFCRTSKELYKITFIPLFWKHLLFKDVKVQSLLHH